jgi:hypothetical protein
MPGNTAPSIQSSQSGNRSSHAAPRGFQSGRSVEWLASGAKFKVMREIAKNGYVHLWKPVAIYRYGVSIYGNFMSICGNVSIYGSGA